MNIDVNKYPVRRSNPIVKGSYGLPEDIQRYIVKGQGLIGIELEKGDNLFLKNLEGNQICEITIFDACLLYTSPSPRDATLSRMPSSA